MDYIYIFGMIFLTVYGQLILKWRIVRYVPFPEAITDKILYLFSLLGDVYIFSVFISAFIASLFWMVAVTKFDLSFAYPFTSLSFVLVLIFSVLLFNESLSWLKLLGLMLIVSGVIVTSQSN